MNRTTISIYTEDAKRKNALKLRLMQNKNKIINDADLIQYCFNLLEKNLAEE